MNPKLLLCLGLILYGGLKGSTVQNHPGVTQTSDWGPTSNGLRCRLTLPATIEQGMDVPATIELQADPAELPPGIRRLNTFMRDAFFKLTLTDARTGKQFEIKAFFYQGPPRRYTGSDLLDLNQPLKPWQVNFPSVAVYSNLVPADYVCQATFSFPTNPPGWFLEGAAFDPTWWHGTIVSGNVRLRVLPETPKFQTFWIPKRLVVTKELTNLRAPGQPPLLAAIPVIRFHKADEQTVRLQLRNGHYLWTKIDRQGQQTSFTGGALIPDDINPIGQWLDYKGQDLAVDYRIDVFEVGVGDPDDLGPGAPGYRSLWSRTLHVSITAKQFRELPATVVNVPSGSDDRECVALIRANPEAEELSLENSGLTDADMALIGRLWHLRVLNLYGTRITDAGLVHLQKMTQLQDLNLDGTRVTDSGVLGLRRLTRLEKFGLGNTSITDQGAAVVSAFPHLKQLDLWNTRIGDETAARLSELKQLEWLDLRGTKVTNKGTQALTHLGHLQDLRLPAAVSDNGSEVK